MTINKGSNAYTIDDRDAERVGKYNWYWDASIGYWCTFRRINGFKRKIYLHRFIMGDVPAGRVVDHINHDTSDNRRDNLRICSPSLNLRNKRVRQNTKTGYANIEQVGRRYRLRAYIDGKKKTLGRYDSIAGALDAKGKYWLDLFGLDLLDEIDEAIRELKAEDSANDKGDKEHDR